MKTEDIQSIRARAREAFIKARRFDNSQSNYHTSLAKDWTGRGFKDYNINRHWENFLEGWISCMNTKHPGPVQG